MEYCITKYISEGSFGKIYKAVNLITKKKVIIKQENKQQNFLINEKKCYDILSNTNITPLLFSFTQTENFNLLILEYYGKSLGYYIERSSLITVYQKHNYTNLSIRESLSIAKQIITILYHLHTNNIIHRDIKPENFLLYNKQLKVKDFGLSTIGNNFTSTSKKINKKGNHAGTPRYVSVSGYNGFEQTYKDDFESAIYLIIYCFQGFLPWQNSIEIPIPKENIKMEVLFERTPSIFLNMFINNRKLANNNIPDYKNILKMI